jgi:Flp pilus assembly protein TadD
MPSVQQTLDLPLPAQQAQHLDKVCDNFEQAWKTAGTDGTPPRIEEYLADTCDPERSQLLHQLILLDIAYRQLRGEAPAEEEYRPRFPSISSRFLAEALAAPAIPPSIGCGSTLAPSLESAQFHSERYVVRQFHARGGIGEVWLAEDMEIGRPVALKRLREQRSDQHDRFLGEARITGQLEHPGIVPIHDLGVDAEGRPFYIMTFIHGRTFKDVIDDYHAGRRADREPLEVQRCRLLEIFVKVCEAVAYAHNRGVIHRDLKPDNVMLGPYGETLVLDWGMAKILNLPEQPAGAAPMPPTYFTSSTKTQAGLVMGSPWYMAPEVAEGRAADADERTDVYLLGATLYHVLTGHAPREGRSYQEIIELARKVVPPPPRKVKREVPRALEAICLKAMALDRQDRYASALDLGGDVQRYMAGAPVLAYPEPLLARAWRWCKRRRVALTRSLIGAAVLGVALLAVVLVRDALEEQDRLRVAAQEKEEKLLREAETSRRREQVRRDLAEFYRLAERPFYAPSITQTGDHSLSHYSRPGQDAGEKALLLADRLAPELEQLAMRDEQTAFHKQLHDLLLMMVQAQGKQSPGPETVRAMLRRLERAASLREPSRGYYRLRSRCYQLLGDTGQRDEEARKADGPGLPASAMDHFLLADQALNEAVSPGPRQGDPTKLQLNPEWLTRAIEHYQAALRIEPDHFWCHSQLGFCYLSQNRGSEAVEAFGTCVALRPKWPWGYSARGLALGLTGRHGEGEADLEKALALEPGYRPALLNRGILARRQGKVQRALADFGMVLEPPAEQTLLEAAYYRGLLLAERQKYVEALADFDRVVREAPGFRFVYLSRAQIHFLRDDPRGLADLTTFLELGRGEPLDPKGHLIYALRGRLLRHLVPDWGLNNEQTKAALNLARDQSSQALRLGGRSAEALEDLGALLESLGEPTKALDAYTQALAATPLRDVEARLLSKRGWILAQSSERSQQDKAQEDFASLLRLEPHNADAHAGLGYLAARRKSATEAQRETVHALLTGYGDYLALHNLACIYAELSLADRGQEKQYQDTAIALLQRAVELWRRGGTGPNEIGLIRGELSFKELRKRKEIKKLIGQ